MCFDIIKNTSVCLPTRVSNKTQTPILIEKSTWQTKFYPENFNLITLFHFKCNFATYDPQVNFIVYFEFFYRFSKTFIYSNSICLRISLCGRLIIVN